MANPDIDPATGAVTADDRLASRLLAPETFPQVAADCESLAAAQIKNKGMTLRTAFGVVQKVKPDILERTVREQLPDFVHELEPLYAEHRAGDSNDLRAFLVAHDARVADAALTVADRRAERIYSRTIRSAYNRVRGRAHREIVAAVPELAAVIARHADQSA